MDISLIASEVECFFKCICRPSGCLLGESVRVLCPFLIGLFVSLLLSYMSSFYILDINIRPLSEVSFAYIFSPSVGCFSVLFMVSFAVQKLLV